MIKGAEKSIVLVTTPQGLVRKVNSLKQALQKAKQKGVKIRIATQMTKDIKNAVKEIENVAEIKNTNVKSRFCIVDGKQVAFMLLDDKETHPTYDSAVWINTPFFASALEGFFNESWAKMKSSEQ